LFEPAKTFGISQKSVAQVILRWLTQRDVVAIAILKSSNGWEVESWIFKGNVNFVVSPKVFDFGAF